MSYNSGNARRIFYTKWNKLWEEYRAAGIRTLCATCLRHFVEAKAFKIALVPSPDRSMDTCTVCQMRRGYDYVVMYR